MKQKQPILVAHRGWPARYPENTLIGIEAALKAGAKAIEFDVQLSADKMPMLFHDETLMRITGREGYIMETGLAALKTMEAYEPGRFEDRYKGTPVSTLSELVELLADYPDVEVFVEIKRESMVCFGIEVVMDRVIEKIAPIRAQCVLTSFEAPALLYSRETGFKKIAWVISEYGPASEKIAGSLQPDFLVCNRKKIPATPGALWPGNWQWMLYVSNDPREAMQCFETGARYVETDDIGAMLPAFQSQ
ncbi:MAG TPA: glycerophosphodiester phosphodiesterase family protein [Gammaproteobacteria bacterium]